MTVFYLDTSSSYLYSAIVQNDKVIASISKKMDKDLSKMTLPAIAELFEEAHLTPNEIDKILVVNGPGSFTGTRLGVTDAKMLAYTLNIPIKTITSIEAIALSVPEKDKIVCISDNKGKYIGEFKDNKLIKDIYYIKNDLVEELFSNIKDKVYIDQKIDLDKISNQLSTLNPVNVHLANPIYIKTIEALSDK